MTAQTVVFIFGGILILIGILGGGFEIKELKIPRISGGARILSLVGGVLLFGVGTVVLDRPSQSGETKETKSAKIEVVSGTYGKNCGAPYGNVTSHLASKCNGHESCIYKVDYKTIGDPARGCKKDYIAEWKCGANERIRSASVSGEAGFGANIHLSCE